MNCYFILFPQLGQSLFELGMELTFHKWVSPEFSCGHCTSRLLSDDLAIVPEGGFLLQFLLLGKGLFHLHLCCLQLLPAGSQLKPGRVQPLLDALQSVVNALKDAQGVAAQGHHIAALPPERDLELLVVRLKGQFHLKAPVTAQRCILRGGLGLAG